MSDPYDPFDSPWAGGDALITGKQLYETLTEQPHFVNAERVWPRTRGGPCRELGFACVGDEAADGRTGPARRRKTPVIPNAARPTM